MSGKDADLGKLVGDFVQQAAKEWFKPTPPKGRPPSAWERATSTTSAKPPTVEKKLVQLRSTERDGVKFIRAEDLLHLLIEEGLGNSTAARTISKYLAEE